MKKPITILVCCALLAPLAFAQPESKGKGQGATTTEEITVTGSIIKMTSEEGSAANYQPPKTLVVREDSSNTAGSYVLNGRGHVLNKKGEGLFAVVMGVDDVQGTIDHARSLGYTPSDLYSLPETQKPWRRRVQERTSLRRAG